MEIKDYKNYLPFIISVTLFVIAFIYCVFLYINWNEKLDDGIESVEVNLPIIDWAKYTGLSKQYQNGSIIKN